MMMIACDVYTKAELRKAIIRRFGEDARFYTCSVQNMDSDALIEKLDREGCFLLIGDGFLKDRSNRQENQ